MTFDVKVFRSMSLRNGTLHKNGEQRLLSLVVPSAVGRPTWWLMLRHMMQCPPPPETVVEAIYHAAFNRTPQPGSVDYWLDAGIQHLAYAAVHGTEPTVGELDAWYERALGRSPDPDGLTFWLSQPAHEALYGIVTSTEATGCVTEHDAAMGEEPVTVEDIIRAAAREFGVSEQLMLDVAWCESRLDPQAANKHSTARGLFQWLVGSWEYYGGLDGSPIDPSADRYDPSANARLAAWVMSWHGTSSWAASRRCHGH